MYRTRIVAKNPSIRTGLAKLNIEIEFKFDYNKSRIYMPTNETINFKHWSKGKLSKSQNKASNIISRVDLVHSDIKNTLFNLEREFGFVNEDIFKEKFNFSPTNNKPVIDLLDEYIELKKLTAKTALVYKFLAIRKHLLSFFNGEKYYLHHFNQDFINRLTYYWQEKIGLQPNTIYKNFKFIRQFLFHLKKADILKSDKYRNFDYPREIETNTVVLDREEVLKLINFEPTQTRHLKVKNLFLVLIYTGLRFSDAVRINKSWVNNNSLMVRAQKTDDKLIIPIHSKLKDVLKKYDYDLIKLKISNQKFNKYVKELCKLAKIDREVEYVKYVGKIKNYLYKPKYELIGSHTGRRTFITNAIVAGIPLPVIQSITGHKKLSTLQKYIGVADATKASEMDKLSNYYI